MITVVSDTHGTDDHRLAGRTLTAVREADLVVHAGDFTTETVLDAFERVAGADADTGRTGGASNGDGASGGDSEGGASEGDGSGAFVAVAGNNDDAAVRARLDATRVVDWAGVRFVVVHGHEHDATHLSFLERQERADLVVVGHSHRPEWRPGGVPVLNPGSHADPRWHRPAHAELEPTAEGLSGRLVALDGDVLEAFDLDATGGQ